jgi:hypothetical protein
MPTQRNATERAGNHWHVDVCWVLGLAAEAKRLWSVAKHVPTDASRQMDAQMFKMIVFLKVNDEHWKQVAVCNAIMNLKKARAAARQEEPSDDESNDWHGPAQGVPFCDILHVHHSSHSCNHSCNFAQNRC